MEDKGCSREEVLSFLAGLRSEDLHHDHILSSMCTIPHPIAVAVHEMFSATNLGDPGLYPGTTKVEDLLIHSLGELMHLPNAGGYSTSGGTESNLQAIRIAKKLKPEAKNPNIVVPASAPFRLTRRVICWGLRCGLWPTVRTIRWIRRRWRRWWTKTPLRLLRLRERQSTG